MEAIAVDFHRYTVQLPGRDVKLEEITTTEKFEELLKLLAGNLFDRKVIGNSTHYRSKTLGVELEYDQGKLNSAFLYLNEKNMNAYTGKLPHGLLATSTMQDTLYRLGEPSSKHGGKSTYVQLTYERLGLEISFQTTGWEQKQAKILYLVLFQQDTSKPAHCAFCKKPATLACPSCRYVSYCSQQCRSSFTAHLKHCP